MTKPLSDALMYTELGMYAFVVFFVLAVIISFITPIFLGQESLESMPLIVFGGSLLTLPPLIMALTTYVKLVKPLKHSKKPLKRWRVTLEILGYFFGLFVGGVMFYVANRKIDLIEKTPNEVGK